MDRPSDSILSRRDSIKLTIAGGASMLRNVLPGFSEAAGKSPPAKAVADMNAKTRNVIMIILTGGMSSLDSWDYRPDAPVEIRGPFKGIRTKTKKSVFSDQFPELASIDDKFVLLPAMHATTHGNHQDAYRNWLHSNKTHLFAQLFKNVPGLRYVDAVAPGVRPLMQPERAELMLPEALQILWDDQKKDYISDVVVESPEDLDDRMELRGKLNTSRVGGDAVERMEAQFRRAYDILSRGLMDTFGSEEESDSDERAKRYGDNPYGKIFSVAGKLADPDDGNVKLVVIETGDWDHHEKLVQRFAVRAPHMDRAMRALIDEYGDRVIVTARGEFGRKALPQVNQLNNFGRDHDPRHASIVAGPGIKPGRYGISDLHKNKEEIVTDIAYAQSLLVATGDLKLASAPHAIRQILKAA